MKRRKFLYGIFHIFLIAGCLGCDARNGETTVAETFTAFVVNPNEANVELFWRGDAGENFNNIQSLKNYVEKNGRRLRFAMNGGMYQADGKPLGLFIQNRKTVAPLNTRENARGNFYIKPNGVFYITTDRRAFVVKTQNFTDDGRVNFATQSGPMLVADGVINPEFKQNSDNLNVRNGVCVLESGEIVFAISRKSVNFYDFAEYFKRAGCRNALYLDGYVSRMYLPEKSIADLDGDFGVIIGVAE